MSDLTPMEKLVFGQNARLHPITTLPLESGSGCLSDDLQARVCHLPVIAREQGQAAAQAILALLNKAAVPPAETAAVSAERAPTNSAQAKINTAQLAQNESDALKRKRDEKFAAAKAAYDAKVAAARAEFDAVSTPTPKN